jgi:acyl carrier protein phosphodiesterase
MDVFTDSHPSVTALRARFEPPWRRYAGILIDVYFDHALARDWSAHAPQALAEVSRECGDALAANADWLPASLNRFAGYMRAHGLFAAYAHAGFIEQVLAGIGTRLRRANPLAAAGPALWQRRDQLDAAFAAFFPQAQEFARRERTDLLAAMG